MVEKIYLETSEQQRSTTDVFELERDYGKATIAFFDSVKKQRRYRCMYFSFKVFKISSKKHQQSADC